MVSTPAPMPSVAKHASVASGNVPYDWFIEEEKIRAWFTDGFPHYAGTTQKWIIAANNLQITSERYCQRKQSSQWADFWENT